MICAMCQANPATENERYCSTCQGYSHRTRSFRETVGSKGLDIALDALAPPARCRRCGRQWQRGTQPPRHCGQPVGSGAN